MAQINQQKLIPFLALTTAMILWSSSFIALKIAFRDYDPMVVIFGRMLVASLCFLVVGKRLVSTLHYRKGDYKLILFMAFCEPCLYFIFEARAIENTTASQAGIITAILPILVLVGAYIFLKEPVRKATWLGAITALLGVCWLTLESSPSAEAPNPALGNFYEFLAMVCAAGYTISLKHLTSRYSPFFLTAVQAVVGSIFFLPLLFLPQTELPGEFAPSPILAIVYLGAVITLGAYGLYNFGLKHLPAGQAAMFVNLIPVFAVFLGWMILGETLSIKQTIATLLILAGVWISQRHTDKS